MQINGKKRDLLNLDVELSEKEILNKLMINDKTLKHLEGKKIKKTIYIKNKLINIII